MNKKLTFALSSALLLGACANHVGEPDFFQDQTQEVFGRAVNENIAAQTVNPNAPEGGAIEASGARTAAAKQRYEDDKVEKPKGIKTQSTEVTTEAAGK